MSAKKTTPLNLNQPIGLALTTARTTCARTAVDQHTQVTTRLAALTKTLTVLGTATLADVVAQAHLITALLSGVDDIQGCSSQKERHAVHSARNTVATLLMANALSRDEDATTALARMPKVADRSHDKQRALEEDEVVVMRLDTFIRANIGGRGRTVAAQYVLFEHSAQPGETTTICPTDFNDERQPTTVTLPGVGVYTSRRTIALEPWAQQVLRIILDEHIASRRQAKDIPIAYSGSNASGSPAASAAVSGNVAKTMAALGFGTGKARPEPSSIIRWAATRIHNELGVKAATDFTGRGDVQEFLYYVKDSAVRLPASHKNKRPKTLLGI